MGTILLAGLAGLALVKLLSASNKTNRSTAEKLLIGGLLVAVGALVLSLRRSAERYYA